jgi:hypothetical protein
MRCHLLLSVLVALPAALAAQAGAPAPGADRAGAGAVPSVRAVQLAGDIRVDGRLDERAWAQATPASGFVTQWPRDREPASQRTEVRILYDEHALYVGARMFDTRPDSIAAQLARRDVSGIYSDWVHVLIDSYHDRRTGFRFSVNPKGVQKDVRHFDDGNEDLLWDAVWEVSTRVDSLGWTAEYRIPFSQLRYSAGTGGQERVWGVQFGRDVARYEERSNWAPIPQNASGYVSRSGELRGLDALGSPSRLEVLPYASSRLARVPGEASNPFYRKNASTVSVGGDFRYGVTSGLTLTGTVNPDFGQVELDPAIVNLSAFEVFLPERRPFFIEGGEIFGFGQFPSNNSFGGGQFFYSRRVGRAPQRSAGGPDMFGERPLFVDAPTESSILGAVKLSGKTRNGWSIGVLDAVTSPEEARLFQRLTPPGGAEPLELERTTPVEPRSNYFVGRTRKDFNRGQTVVGGIVTNVVRALDGRDQPFDVTLGRTTDGPEVFRNMLHQSASVVGVDFEHNWSQRDWAVGGFAAASRVAGTPQVLTSTQRAPYRLLQRPDGTRDVDPNRESLVGHIGALSVSKRGGRHWFGSLAYQEFSPTLELNDFGFGQTTDRRTVSTFLQYRENTPSARFRSYGVGAYTNHSYNFAGDNMFDSYNMFAHVQRPNFWLVETGGGFQPRYFNDRLLRGGPLSRTNRLGNGYVFVRSDTRKPLIVSGNVNYSGDESGERTRSANLTFEMRPTSNVRVSLSPGLSRDFDTDQFVQRQVDALATRTYGTRYVFADVEQANVSMTTRVNWTFTPRLSLEMVAQPFVATGRFANYKEFAERGAFRFERYGEDAGTVRDEYGPVRDATGAVVDSARVGYRVDPDGTGPAASFLVNEQNFTFRSLRGSAVMRWEYRPGSTLFFVWQQQRSGQTADGSLVGDRDLSGIFREPAQNVFVVKATYWLAR